MKKKLSPLMIIHMIVMVGLMVCNVFAMVIFIGSFRAATAHTERLEALMNSILMLVILAMLVTGVLYLWKRYDKQAAGWYKTFLLLQVAVSVLTIIIDVFFSKLNTLLITRSSLYVGKTVLLLILALWKDLGKKKTWILFCVLLALDICGLLAAIIFMSKHGFDFSFVGFITALIADGTIGLAIRGKYADKDARGTK